MKKFLIAFLIVLTLVSPVFAGGSKEKEKEEEVITVLPDSEKNKVTTITTSTTVLATVKLYTETQITKGMVDEFVAATQAEGQELDAQTALNSLIAQAVYAQFIENEAANLSDEELQYYVVQAAASIAAQYGYSISADQVADFITNSLGVSIQDFANMVLPQIIVEKYLTENYADFLNEIITDPTEEQIEKTYNDNIDLFKVKESVRVAHIFIPLSDDAAENATRLSTMNSVKTRLNTGVLTFEKAVADYSQDSGSNTNGGVISGWLEKDSELGVQYFGEDGVNTIFSLSVGQISKVVEGPSGYHIFKLIAHNDARTLGLDDEYAEGYTVKQFLTEAILEEFYNQALSIALNDKLLPELMEQATITTTGV
jgi:parvulin-like peptidyl-prolyl isomerase